EKRKYKDRESRAETRYEMAASALISAMLRNCGSPEKSAGGCFAHLARGICFRSRVSLAQRLSLHEDYRKACVRTSPREKGATQRSHELGQISISTGPLFSWYRLFCFRPFQQ